MKTLRPPKPPTPESQKLAVMEWNQRHPIGIEVIVMRDHGEEFRSRTRSAAWVVGGHTAVVSVDGIAGGYLLNRVRPA